MNPSIRKSLIVTSTTLAMLAAMAGTAAAQRGGSHGRSSGSRGSSVSHGPSRASTPQRTAPAQRSAPAVRTGPVAAPRVIATRRFDGPRFTPSFGFGRPTFVRPYYSFRPRFSFGFGLFVGNPVPFPYGYGYGSSYDYGPYGYSPYGYSTYGSTYSVGVAPGYGAYAPGYDSANSANLNVRASGGLSFDIKPADAAVFIDGVYVGTTRDFSPTEPPLMLASGRHHIDLRAQGYQTTSFDITVVTGQVIPYQGTLALIR